MTARKGTWQTEMGEAYVCRVGWCLIYCGRRMQQAFQYMQARNLRLILARSDRKQLAIWK